MKQIPLTQGLFALVDDEDFERVNQYKWLASKESRGTKIYAKRWARKNEKERWKSQFIRLHHFILNVAPHELPPNYVVDHVNHNSLDCRKFVDGVIQLQIVTQEENMRRSAGWKKKVEPWL